MDDFEKELKEDFLLEATELIDDFEQVFLDLEDDSSPEVLDKIFRFAHNLKGTSRAVGFGEVAEFTHEVENLILKLKQGEIAVSSGIVSLLLNCNDQIAVMITGLKADLDATFDCAEILATLRQVISDGGTGDAPESNVVTQAEVETDEVAEEATESEDGFSEADVEMLKALEAVETETLSVENDEEATEEVSLSVVSEESMAEPLKEVVAEAMPEPTAKEVPATKPPSPAPIEAPKAAADWGKDAKNKPNKQRKTSEDEFIRVALQKVERLNNYVGELVLLQTVLEQRRFVAISDDLANKSISQLSKLSKEIQDISMSMRMVPIKSTLQKMNRIVRDTSKTLDKNVKLQLAGEETEIDKTVLELVVDPLVHIVRNAVDHGVEMPADRVAAGKPEQGRIDLKAYHQGNSLVIEVKDDGKGVDPAVIRQKAIEKGVIKESANLSDQEYINLLFHAGFSTKEQVSEVSGRGVGMDVVKTNIEQLGGEVLLESVFGEGSTCRIFLPLTLAIIDGIIVSLNSEKFIFPLNQINEFLRPTQDMISHVTGIGDCLTLRGAVLPIFDLGTELKRGKSQRDYTQAICVICQVKDMMFAVKVDDVVNQQQIVVKSLGPDIRNQKGFMGGSILGDGNPSFIIDVAELFKDKLAIMPQGQPNKRMSA